MRTILILAVVALALGADAAVKPMAANADGEPVDYVNPFVGTAARVDTYPGPVWPLGMVQPGPA